LPVGPNQSGWKIKLCCSKQGSNTKGL
jgi:hypothetical protein